MKAHVHYEAAFEDCLRCRGVPYVAVDEARRSMFRESKLKSFDFIVYSARATNWLVDVKGRRWAARRGSARPTWENWVTLSDLEGLHSWETVFGGDFRGLLVFAYWIDSDASPPEDIAHCFRDQRYVFAAIPIDVYEQSARTRSPKWGTVNLPVRDFAAGVRPLTELI